MTSGYSEQQPLLASYATDGDPESARVDPEQLSSHQLSTRWRARTAEILELPRLHKAIIALIAIDACCVLADLGYTVLSPTCTPVEGDGAPIWLEVLSHVSLAITSLLLFEVPITLWALGLVTYNPWGPVPHAALHLFDAIVLLTTFILEVVLRGKERELAGLLILLRLWRLVKLVGGIAVGAGELQEDTLKRLEETRRRLEESHSTLQTVREENQDLKARLSRYESSDP